MSQFHGAFHMDFLNSICISHTPKLAFLSTDVIAPLFLSNSPKWDTLMNVHVNGSPCLIHGSGCKFPTDSAWLCQVASSWLASQIQTYFFVNFCSITCFKEKQVNLTRFVVSGTWEVMNDPKSDTQCNFHTPGVSSRVGGLTIFKTCLWLLDLLEFVLNTGKTGMVIRAMKDFAWLARTFKLHVHKMFYVFKHNNVTTLCEVQLPGAPC